MNEVPRSAVASGDEGIFAVDHLQMRVRSTYGRQMRIVLPKGFARTSHVSDKLSRMALVQITNRRRQHENVAGRLLIAQKNLPHGLVRIVLTAPVADTNRKVEL